MHKVFGCNFKVKIIELFRDKQVSYDVSSSLFCRSLCSLNDSRLAFTVI